MGRPDVYPTGTTVYYPEEAYNGYTVFDAEGYGILLINMNGKVVRSWKNFTGFPPKILPGGHLIGTKVTRKAENGYQDMEDLTMVDMDGNVEWTFNHNQLINDPDGERWMARQHHDYQVTVLAHGLLLPGPGPRPELRQDAHPHAQRRAQAQDLAAAAT